MSSVSPFLWRSNVLASCLRCQSGEGELWAVRRLSQQLIWVRCSKITFPVWIFAVLGYSILGVFLSFGNILWPVSVCLSLFSYALSIFPICTFQSIRLNNSWYYPTIVSIWFPEISSSMLGINFQGSRSYDAWLTPLCSEGVLCGFSQVNHTAQLSWFLVSSFPFIKWGKTFEKQFKCNFLVYLKTLRTLDNAYQCFQHHIFTVFF